MSGGIAPSKSTVYVSNLPFSLTNNDLHKVFEKHGKVVKVTIMSDKITRKSKGVAFVLYLERDSAHKCVTEMNGIEMFGRTLRCSIAKDNGRAADYIRRKEYKDKSRCYQCGELDHLSYSCPKNILGDREPPPKKEKKRRQLEDESENTYDSDDSTTAENPKEDSLAMAITIQQNMMEENNYRWNVATGNYGVSSSQQEQPKKKRYKPDGYFSDEEELAD